MNKAYERINWQNKPSTTTKINATNLNKMDLALDTIDDRVIDLDTNKMDKSIVKVGNPITFNTVDGGDFSKAEVGFTPKQNLHGYSNPWVGGAGKNKLPLVVSDIKTANTNGTWTDNTYNHNGIDFELQVDNANNVIGINVDGTATGNATLTLKPLSLITANNYILSGCPANGGGSSYSILIGDGQAQVTADYGTGSSFTITEDKNINVVIRVVNGTQVDNLIFYPMIRLSTASEGFEPYSNICPITGYSQLNIFQSSGSTTTPDDTYTTSLGGTYYGGTLDFATGKLTIDKAYIDLGTLNWAVQSGVTGGFNTIVSGIKKGVLGTKANIISSIYTVVETKSPASDMMSDGDSIMGLVNGYETLVVKEISKDGLTGAQFKTAMDGVQLVYELATPTETTLTPTQISALVGDNAMWTDGDTLSVKISMYVDSMDVAYDNTSSGLTATNVQDAIDELKALISALGS